MPMEDPHRIDEFPPLQQRENSHLYQEANQVGDGVDLHFALGHDAHVLSLEQLLSCQVDPPSDPI